jgi:hypothetical protein
MMLVGGNLSALQATIKIAGDDLAFASLVYLPGQWGWQPTQSTASIRHRPWPMTMQAGAIIGIMRRGKDVFRYKGGQYP